MRRKFVFVFAFLLVVSFAAEASAFSITFGRNRSGRLPKMSDGGANSEAAEASRRAEEEERLERQKEFVRKRMQAKREEAAKMSPEEKAVAQFDSLARQGNYDELRHLLSTYEIPIKIDTFFMAASENPDPDVMTLLVVEASKQGVEIINEEREGLTALYFAVNSNNYEVVERLLELGANPSFRVKGMIPLTSLAEGRRIKFRPFEFDPEGKRIARLLRQYGGKP